MFRSVPTCEDVRAPAREGRDPADGLALTVARQDTLVGTIRLWDVAAGPSRPALLLGPVAVDPSLQGLGIGSKLIREALARAAALGRRAVLLVGDAPYYRRFGFSHEAVGRLWLPGPYEPERFLGFELVPGALSGAQGLVQATGATRPDLAAAARLERDGEAALRRAA